MVVMRVPWSPLERGVSADRLLLAVVRLRDVMEDSSRPAWLRSLAAMKATEGRAFARVLLVGSGS